MTECYETHCSMTRGASFAHDDLQTDVHSVQWSLSTSHMSGSTDAADGEGCPYLQAAAVTTLLAMVVLLENSVDCLQSLVPIAAALAVVGHYSGTKTWQKPQMDTCACLTRYHARS